MTIKLVDHREPIPARDDGGRDVAALLKGACVARVGRLAALDPEEFDRVCERHGATPVADLAGCTVAVIGEGQWPRTRRGARECGDRLTVLEELDRRATAKQLVVLQEREFV